MLHGIKKNSQYGQQNSGYQRMARGKEIFKKEKESRSKMVIAMSQKKCHGELLLSWYRASFLKDAKSTRDGW